MDKGVDAVEKEKLIGWGLVALIILFVGAIRLRLLEMPLERDEGEFAYMAQLILQGIPPYLGAYNMKLPGIYAAYALIMSVFGQTSAGIHLGFLIVNAGTVVMVFLLGRYLLGGCVGVVAAASFAILSVSPSVYGTAAHASQFVLLPALAGLLLMLKAVDSDRPGRFLWSGLCLGLAFLMKQPGVFFILFGLLYVVYRSFRTSSSRGSLVRRTTLYACGAMLPLAVTCLIFFFAGIFDKFWYWAFVHPYEWGGRLPLSAGVANLLREAPQAMGQFYWLWILAGAGIGMSIFDRAIRETVPFLLGITIFPFLALSSGLLFRNHYFVFVLPAVALLVGVAVRSLRRIALSVQPKLQIVPVILVLMAFGAGVSAYRSFFFERTPVQACRAMYGPNPFPESIAVAEYIQKHSNKEDQIVILGSEAQIYFYSHRHAATHYIYTYQMMEIEHYAPRMQKEMVEEIDRARPAYLIFVNVFASWLIRPNSERFLFRWFEGYAAREFDLVGVVDILSENRTEYRWDREIAGYVPRSPHFIWVFKRKTL